MDSKKHYATFYGEEEEKLQARATLAGMKVPQYIRHMALTGRVRVFDLTPLLKQEEQIGKVMQLCQKVINQPHPDRWLYQYDLERIEDELEVLRKIAYDELDRIKGCLGNRGQSMACDQ